MSFFATHRSARWAVPVTAVALIAGGTVAMSRTASADAGLPARSAAQLLADVRGAAGTSLSGTVVQTSNLGLPEIPGLGGQGGGSPVSSSGGASLTVVASGTHTWRVWSGGPTQSRVALVSGSGESDVIRNGADVWVWSSAEKSAVHHTLKDATGTPSPAPTDLPTSPEAAATKALAAIDPSTAVTTAGTAVVAGRPAYELVLDPRTDATRVAQVRIAVDAEKHVPLRVQIYSTKESNPAVEVGFTAVDFSAPDARQFGFTPPAGTTVSEGSTSTPGSAAGAATTAQAEPKVVGTGWTSVVVAHLPAQYATGATQKQVQSLLSAIPKVSGDWGSGRVVDGTLVSAVITDDGRVAVGAVDPAALYAALKAS